MVLTNQKDVEAAISANLIFSGVAYVITWPLFDNHDCYIPKCLS